MPRPRLRLGFFTRVLDDAPPAERYRLAVAQVGPCGAPGLQLRLGRPAPLPWRRGRLARPARVPVARRRPDQPHPPRHRHHHLAAGAAGARGGGRLRPGCPVRRPAGGRSRRWRQPASLQRLRPGCGRPRGAVHRQPGRLARVLGPAARCPAAMRSIPAIPGWPGGIWQATLSAWTARAGPAPRGTGCCCPAPSRARRTAPTLPCTTSRVRWWMPISPRCRRAARRASWRPAACSSPTTAPRRYAWPRPGWAASARAWTRPVPTPAAPWPTWSRPTTSTSAHPRTCWRPCRQTEPWPTPLTLRCRSTPLTRRTPTILRSLELMAEAVAPALGWVPRTRGAAAPGRVMDAIDTLAGILPGSALEAARARRPTARDQAQASLRRPVPSGGPRRRQPARTLRRRRVRRRAARRHARPCASTTTA